MFISSFQALSPTTQAASPNDIIINEFIANPSAVSDTRGEWIELFNPTEDTINLNGWTISDLGSNSHTISEDLIIEANSYIVLGRNNDPDSNGGLNIDYVYSSFTLSNGDDEIILTDTENNIIDFVEYDTDNNWIIANGESLELIDPEQNHNNSTNWATSLLSYGDSDFGTPSAFNSQSILPDTTAPLSSSSLNSGMYYTPQTVTLSAIEPEKDSSSCTTCRIYYTLDGSTPTTSSTLYTSPIPIHLRTILKFFAIDSSNNQENTIHTNYYAIIYLNGSPFNFKSEFGSGAISLTWDSVPNAQSYQLYRSTDRGRSYSYLDTTEEESYLDLNVLSGGNYKYRLFMVDANGKIKSISTTFLTLP